jgi:acetylcholinesterase
MTPEDMGNFLQNNYPRLTNDDAAAIIEQYPPGDPVPGHGPWFPATARAFGEATFICPAGHILNSITQNTNVTRAWGYRYDVFDQILVDQGLGVVHCFEVGAVLGPENLLPEGGPPSYYTYNAPIIPIMMDYWLSFVKTLDPNTGRNAAAPAWDMWGTDQKRLLIRTGDETTANITSEFVPPDQRSRCEMWKSLAPITQQK